MPSQALGKHGGVALNNVLLDNHQNNCSIFVSLPDYCSETPIDVRYETPCHNRRKIYYYSRYGRRTT
ncbi:hypothetical protein CEXT_741001 [Caerostris extrusa]|uniref:Uncharacterized protein n=1 Tax=Caerostris extrusa TaxID=172846 RepID=A0AAV4T3M6_CAEEX|nr:hypothetical protein CEXT_741001 [Caerostris extrusa]